MHDGTPSDSAILGTTVGSYRIERCIGRGGMGAIYEMVHPDIGKRLALKILHEDFASRPDIVRRFIDEARAVNHIGHKNILDIIDFGTLDSGHPYLTMELLEGESIGGRIARLGALPLVEIHDTMTQLLSALSAVHTAGIIHRDLKPDNLFACRDGSLKVLDFGIAKLTGAIASGDFPTLTGAIIGTPSYMPPEQALGEKDGVDARSDLYAAGLVLFEMLAGRRAFDGENAAAIITAQLHSPPPDINQLRPTLPLGWSMILGQALDKNPDRRFQNATTFATALAALPVESAIITRGPDEETLAALAGTKTRVKTPVLPVAEGRATTDVLDEGNPSRLPVAIAVLAAVLIITVMAALWEVL